MCVNFHQDFNNWPKSCLCPRWMNILSTHKVMPMLPGLGAAELLTAGWNWGKAQVTLTQQRQALLSLWHPLPNPPSKKETDGGLLTYSQGTEKLIGESMGHQSWRTRTLLRIQSFGLTSASVKKNLDKHILFFSEIWEFRLSKVTHKWNNTQQCLGIKIKVGHQSWPSKLVSNCLYASAISC